MRRITGIPSATITKTNNGKITVNNSSDSLNSIAVSGTNTMSASSHPQADARKNASNITVANTARKIKIMVKSVAPY